LQLLIVSAGLPQVFNQKPVKGSGKCGPLRRALKDEKIFWGEGREQRSLPSPNNNFSKQFLIGLRPTRKL